MVGYTKEELRAVNFLELTHEDYRQANWALIPELLNDDSFRSTTTEDRVQFVRRRTRIASCTRAEECLRL